MKTPNNNKRIKREFLHSALIEAGLTPEIVNDVFQKVELETKTKGIRKKVYEPLSDQEKELIRRTILFYHKGFTLSKAIKAASKDLKIACKDTDTAILYQFGVLCFRLILNNQSL